MGVNDNSVLGGPPGMMAGPGGQNEHLTPLKGSKVD